MANKNEGKAIGEACAYCGEPLTSGKWGAWCPPCNDKYKKSKGNGSAPAKSSGGYNKTKPLREFLPMFSRQGLDMAISEGEGIDKAIEYTNRFTDWFLEKIKSKNKSEPKTEPKPESVFESPIDDTDDIPF